MTVSEAIKKGFENLKEKSLTPQLDAEVLLSFILSQDKSWLLTHFQESIYEDQIESFFKMIDRRSKSEPIAYITGFKSFYGHNFHVNPNVLIPRPASEAIIELIKTNPPDSTLNIVDVGTGSGCLAISTALLLPNSHVTALDISKQALDIAKQNAKLNNANNVNFLVSDLLENYHDKADIIIANLPYLENIDLEDSPTDKDLKFEPKQALVAADKGLKLIKKCTQQAVHILKPQGKVYLEMLPRQIPIFIDWLKSEEIKFTFKIETDLGGVERFIVLSN